MNSETQLQQRSIASSADGSQSAAQPSLDEIYARLDNVYDPELDESILKLGFVNDVQIDGHNITIIYTLPTFWCAPNFAYMMSSDIREEVQQVAGVRNVRVVLREHCRDEQINTGINKGQLFSEVFPGEALDDLNELRRKFLRKSFLVRQEQLIRRLHQAGLSESQLVELRLVDIQPAGDHLLVHVPGSITTHVRSAAGDLSKYLRKRRLLELPDEPDTHLVISLAGTPLRAESLPEYLRRSRLTRISIAFNTSLCEGLLRTRYDAERPAAQHRSNTIAELPDLSSPV